ncbi:MAG: hypothetical protein AAF658_13615, partial [Myxococcota bacterium]
MRAIFWSGLLCATGCWSHTEHRVEVLLPLRAALDGPLTDLWLDVRSSAGELIAQQRIDDAEVPVVVRLNPAPQVAFELRGVFDNGETVVASYLARRVVDLFSSQRIALQAFDAGTLRVSFVESDGTTPLAGGISTRFVPLSPLQGYDGEFQAFLDANGRVELPAVATQYTVILEGDQETDLVFDTSIAVVATRINPFTLSLPRPTPPV